MTEHDPVQNAFDRLRSDAARVDSMAALATVGPRRGRAWLGPSLALATAVIALVVAVAVFIESDDTPEQVAADGSGDDATDRTTQPPTSTSHPAPTVTRSALDGTSWQLVEGSGPDGEIHLFQTRITLTFRTDHLTGDGTCNRYGAAYTVDGSAFSPGVIEAEEEGCADGGTEARYFTALAGADGLTLTGSGNERRLELTGPGVRLVFEPARDPISVSELLDRAPSGTVSVEGQLWFRGGSWILCEQIELPFCAGNWVTITNYAAEVESHTDPPTSITEAAFAMAELDGFEASGDVVWTPDPRVLGIELLPDGRAHLPHWPSGADISDDEQALLDAFVAVSTDGPIDTGSLRLAEEVQIGLSDQLLVSRTREELADPASWVLDLEAFRAYEGPFSALEVLESMTATEVRAGRHDHCASPPASITPTLRDVRHLSIQPTGIDSCLSWATVDIFVDDTGAVVGITLDLWEP